MKNNKSVNTSSGPEEEQENYLYTPANDVVQLNGLWMEFEDSFIQILSGTEPGKTYYHSADIQRQQISC